MNASALAAPGLLLSPLTGALGGASRIPHVEGDPLDVVSRVNVPDRAGDRSWLLALRGGLQDPGVQVLRRGFEGFGQLRELGLGVRIHVAKGLTCRCHIPDCRRRYLIGK